MRSARLALLCAFLAPAAARAEAPDRVAFVVADSERAGRAIFEKVSRALGPEAEVSRYRLHEDQLSDPIKKGRLLAELANRDLVVAVGDEATDFAARELAEDVPLYFVGAAVVEGRRLQSRAVTGVLSYNVDVLLDAVKSLGLGPVGLAYTPGYEPVVEWIRRGAAERRILLTEKRVDGLKDLAPAIRGLASRSRALWVLGDPMLVRGAGFEFVAERALSTDEAIIGVDEWGVRRGVFLAYEPSTDALSAAARAGIARALKGGAAALRLEQAPAGGTVLLNGPLAQKWKLGAGEGGRWRMIR